LKYHLDVPTVPQPVVGIPDKNIYSITQTPDGIWVATKRGIYKIGIQSHKFYPFNEPKSFINKMVYRDKFLYLAVFDSLIVFDLKKLDFSNVPNLDNQDSAFIWDLYPDQQGQLWISTKSGTYHYNKGSDGIVASGFQSSGYIVKKFITDNKNVWFGNATSGLIKANIQTREPVTHFLTSNSDLTSDNITTLYFDHDQNLWIGTFDGSLNIISQNALAFGKNADILNLPHCDKLAIQATHFSEDRESNLWLVTADEVVKIDRKTSSCQPLTLLPESMHVQGQPSPNIIFADNQGNLWANYHQLGVVQINSQNLTINHIEHPTKDQTIVFNQFVTHQNPSTFVFASSRGLVAYDTTTKTQKFIPSEPIDLEQSIIYNSYPINDDEFLLATSRGVANYDGKNVKLNTRIQTQLPTSSIRTVFKDSMQNIWVGSIDAGLFKFNRQSQLIKHFGNQSALKEQKDILNISEDREQNLWITSFSHLIKLNIESDQVHIFDASDGIQTKKFILGSAFQANSGKMYFGGYNGFNAFFPGQIEIDTTPPPILITQLTRFNQTVDSN